MLSSWYRKSLLISGTIKSRKLGFYFQKFSLLFIAFTFSGTKKFEEKNRIFYMVLTHFSKILRI